MRYVTCYDGTEECIKRIKAMLNMLFWDEYKLRIDEITKALVIETLNRNYTFPKGWDFVITQDGEILNSVG